MTKSGLAVVGIAEVPTRRDPERKRWDILLDVCMGAINDAGIDKNLIGAVISNNPMAQPSMQNDMSLGKIPEVMGLKGCRDIAICNAGGASTYQLFAPCRAAHRQRTSGFCLDTAYNSAVRYAPAGLD